MKIPYGMSDFAQIREEGFFYVDKTPFLPVLEAVYRHVVLLRPRRFGKSTLLSMLEHYYDAGRAKRFDELFRGLWVHEHPTPEKGRYLALTLDFSGVATDRGEEALRDTFLSSVRSRVEVFLARHRERVPAFEGLSARLDDFKHAESLMDGVLGAVAQTDYRVYLLIDEYDHFANRLLSSGDDSLYEGIVKKTGFVRTFFATLKAWTTGGAVGRMFVTGVSPLLLDDLSSGFNIATHASMSPRLATLAGFTRTDTERAVDEFFAARPGLASFDRTATVALLEEYYNGYRFSEDAKERVFNSDMVLYFLREVDDRGRAPDTMLDRNVRTEYGHLQRIGKVAGASSEDRRALLQTIVSEGGLRSRIVEQFGIKSLSSRTHFVSLLYFLGMLTLGGAPRDAFGDDLVIPNRVIRELQWEHLALLLDEEAAVQINVDELRKALGAMAVDGEIEPFLSLFHTEVLQTFSNRDMRGLDEKTIKLLLMTYASLGRAFYPLSEGEFAQGYGDVFLGASRGIAGAKFSWLLELKYVKTGAKQAAIEAAFAEAEAQVTRYASDPALLPMLLGERALKAGMLVFVGAKKALFRPWAPPAEGKKAPRRKAKAR